MIEKRDPYLKALLLCCCCALAILVQSCNTTKHVPNGAHLLRKNALKIKSDRTITNKGVLEDQLNVLVIQKTNTYWSGWFPFKLWKYNWRSEKYIRNQQTEIPNSIERPVIYDSLLQKRSIANMQYFLINQGYFKARVTDTVRYTDKKAYAQYKIVTGVNYLIDRVSVDADDSNIGNIIKTGMKYTLLRKEEPYTKPLIDEERSRIINLMQNNGYFKFSQENVSFELDTVNKESLRDADGLFESAINFITLQKKQKKLSVDIKVLISDTFDNQSYLKYKIGKMVVLPDFIDRSLSFDSSMIIKDFDGIQFRYHKYFIKEAVLSKQIFLRPGEIYSRSNHEFTINKLNELGIFQMVNVYFVMDTSVKGEQLLDCYIALSPSKRLDATGSLEIANAQTYILGNSIGAVYRDKNFFKGANLFSLSATGGVEMGSNDSVGNNFIEHLFLQSTNFSLNSSLLFPKFLSPFKPKWIDKRNLPRTQLLLGVNVLNRIDLFRLTNISSSFAYNWRRTKTQTWDFSPVFANILLRQISPAFQLRLDSSEVLRNTYRRTFIQGENISFTFSDQEKKQNKNFNYLRIGLEEAGLIMAGINSIQRNIGPKQDFIFDQYFKFDLDARRYFNARHSLMAIRFLAGVGSPYGDSKTLPYIKQYFVGGPFSIRGWRPRTLGPKNIKSGANNIDITGDIKLELSSEYRFDMIQLFSGTLNLNGALFADAGNTWLAKKSSDFPTGHFDISRLGHDIAVSTGAGLRVIVAGFFTVRLDAAFPVKNPYNPVNNGWQIQQVDLSNKTWRSNNVIVHLAIGMPF